MPKPYVRGEAAHGKRKRAMNTGYALGEADTRAPAHASMLGCWPGSGRRSPAAPGLECCLPAGRAGRCQDRAAQPSDRDGATAVAVARWLESVDYPAVRAIGVEQPVTVDGHAVTFWGAVSEDGSEYATIAQVAEIIALLHALAPPSEGLRLPELQPFGKAGERIARSEWLNADDQDFLESELARLQAGYACLEFLLSQGVIHGDANIGNVLRDPAGQPVVIDLDDFATGPREWDLVESAMFYERFGWQSREEYETFVKVYGYDLMQWPGYPMLADVREFAMVTWIVRKAGESDKIAAEARKRVDTLRTGASRRDWSPF